MAQTTWTGSNLVNCFSWVELNFWSNFNFSDFGKMPWQIQCESTCVTEVMQPSFALSWNRVTVKIWSQYLHYLQNYLETFVCHLAAAVPVLETDNISPVCPYIVGIWSILMACTWKNRVQLAAFWDKKSIFPLGQTEHLLARDDGPFCAPHHALNSFIWCNAT